MIEFLRGRLARKDPLSVSIDVKGVGYQVLISLHTYDKLPECGENVTLLTHLHVREDAMQLFGFLNEHERQMFRHLQGISGIGAKMALNILSGAGQNDLQTYVVNGNVGALTTIPGIGKKTAERIVVELRDKLASLVSPASDQSAQTEADTASRNEAMMALLALGYSRQITEKALVRAIQITSADDMDTSELIRTALQVINS